MFGLKPPEGYSTYPELGAHQDTARSHVDLRDILIMKTDYKSALEELEMAWTKYTDWHVYTTNVLPRASGSGNMPYRSP